ncbi:tRNA lysidine(34) synthetase TilS [Patescibacteria group bacterium]
MNIEKFFKPKEKLIIAVSGGPDSMCLLHILLKLQKKLDLTLIVAHVNYQLRKKDSDLDQKLVQDFCRQSNLTCFVKKVNDITSSDSNLEAKLRKIRYDFFETVRKKQNADKIVIAHNQDDQIETILMRILRGTGLKGLKGMSEKRDKIVRPLLNVSRKEILDYCQKNKVEFRVDKSNYDKKFFRNQIRHQILPYLEKYSPDLRLNLVRLGRSAERDYYFLETSARKGLQDVRRATGDGRKGMILDHKKWLKLEPALQYEVLRQAILEIRGDLMGIKMVHLDEVAWMLKKGVGNKQKTLSGGLKIELLNGKIRIDTK